MKKTFHLLLAILLLATLLLQATPVQADIAPPEHPPGGSLEADEGTQVRMASELVVLEVEPSPETQPSAQGSTSLAQARVTATFDMVNDSASDETLLVRFPLSNLVGWGDGRGNYPEIEDLQVLVDGNGVATHRVETPNPLRSDDPPLGWAAFEVTFPAGQPVEVLVTYTAQATGYYPQAGFSYIFHTGAGWKDAIGLAKLVLRLPYEASEENVWAVSGSQPSRTTTPGGQIRGSEVVWQWENFEPGEMDDWYGTVVAPRAWQALLEARQAVQSGEPGPEAWLNRADHAYQAAYSGKRYLRSDAGAQSLAEESRMAYEKVLELQPENVEVRVKRADLLYGMLLSEIAPDPFAMVEQVRAEIEAIQKLDPDNQDAGYLAEELQWFEENILPAITPAPTAAITETFAPTPTQEPTPTMLPSSTPAALLTGEAQQPTREPAMEVRPLEKDDSPKPVLSPVCSSATLVLLAIGMVITRKKKG